jgi:hypothetical protein
MAEADASMDINDLWREDIVTDRKIGTLRVMTPIHADGSPDPARAVVYTGEAQMMTNMGPLPINFEIEANSLAEAVAAYGATARAAFERTMRDLQEMRRQSASSLVLPGQGGGGFGAGGLPPGLGGGGKIQMP